MFRFAQHDGVSYQETKSRLVFAAPFVFFE
jgi:hypothetical protein